MPRRTQTWSFSNMPSASEPPPAGPASTARYVDKGLIAMGGMSEVRRVWDTHFDHAVAMKLLRWEFIGHPGAEARFASEAQLTARMQHPGIVAVYAHGRDARRRPWFTMTEVRGETLETVVRRAHLDGPPSGPELRGLVDLLLRAAEAVAYAHTQGIVHRDIKPANIMVGPFSEVLVMDWGIARVLSEDEEPVLRDFVPPGQHGTRVGDVIGTPDYMSPEQAAGDLEAVGPPSDVWALGALLWFTLTATVPPPTPRPAVNPEALGQLAEDALHEDPSARPPDAQAFADHLRAWLSGARRRAEAHAILSDAARIAPGIETPRERARILRREAGRILSDLPAHAPSADKAVVWALEDEAAALEREATLAEVQWLQTVRSALHLAPELHEAHALLARHYRDALLEAEASRRPEEALRHEAMLRTHDRGEHRDVLQGLGSLSLRTEPSGAAVIAHRYLERVRRLVPEFVGSIGTTPLRELPLASGSYLLEIRHPDAAVVHLPVHLARGAHEDHTPPGAEEPHPISLPPEMPPARCYVPAGWAWLGGDDQAPEALPRQRVWVDGFIATDAPITLGEYAAFLDDLVAHGRPDEARACRPQREDLADHRRLASPLLTTDDGRHVPHEDLGPDHPVTMVTWLSATRYATWRAARDGLPWRLPNELEWEKLARGVDGRPFAWGDQPQTTWAHIAGSTAEAPAVHPVRTAPYDRSPYGAWDTVGNVRELCANLWTHDGPCGHGQRLDLGRDLVGDGVRVVRGGHAFSTAVLSRATARFAAGPTRAWMGMGFRLVHSWPCAT